MISELQVNRCSNKNVFVGDQARILSPMNFEKKKNHEQLMFILMFQEKSTKLNNIEYLPFK